LILKKRMVILIILKFAHRYAHILNIDFTKYMISKYFKKA